MKKVEIKIMLEITDECYKSKDFQKLKDFIETGEAAQDFRKDLQGQGLDKVKIIFNDVN